jgi:hypothetical protein
MALTNASRLADFGTGIGTQGAILQVDNADQMVGIGTTDPTSKLEVKGDFKVSAASTLSGAVKISDSTNSTSTTTGALIVTGGVGIGASLHVDGDVSIGGTLTYEDVTNIDSVGLLTARSGLRVTAGGVVVTAGVSTISDNLKVSGGEFTVGTGVTIGIAGVTTFSGTSDIHLLDDIQLKVGDSSDTLLYHDGDHTYLTHPGTGDLRLNANTLQLMSYNSEVYFKGTLNGSSEIYYDNSKKWETTTAGTVTTGIATATGLDVADKITHTGDTDTAIRFPAGDTITAETNGAERLRIASDGQLKQTAASGSTIITFKRSDANTTGAFGVLNFAASDDHSVANIQVLGDGDNEGAHIVFKTTSAAASADPYNAATVERLRITSSGKVGLGTASPAEELHIFGETAVVALVESHGANDSRVRIKAPSNRISYLEFADADDADVGEVRYDHTDNYMAFYANAGERVRINQYGMMGLSVTSPDALLSVLAQNSNTPPFVIQNPSNDENFTISTYYDGNGIYGGIGANYKLNSGGSSVVDTTDHRTAGIFIDARNHGAISFETNNAGSQPSERARIDSNGQMLIGTNTNRGLNGHDPKLQITGTNYSNSTVSIINNANDATGSYLFFVKQRSGAVGGSTVVADNDIIGECRFNAGDGTDIDSLSARIMCHVDGTPGSNDTPGRLTFLTTKDGDNSCTERLRITSKGRVGLTDNTPIARFHLQKDDSDPVAPILYYGPYGKNGVMKGKYVHNGSQGQSNNTNLLTISTFQSSNSHIFGKVNVMGVSPVADFGFEAEGFFYAERGSDDTTITNANFGSMDLVGGTNQTRGTGGNTQGSLSFSGLTLVYATPPVAYVTMRINVEYVVYDGATVVFDTSDGLD